MSKTDQNMKLRNILKREQSSQSVKLLTCWKFHLAQFRASERQSDHALTAISTEDNAPVRSALYVFVSFWVYKESFHSSPDLVPCDLLLCLKRH
jgi:hypothetical protein